MIQVIYKNWKGQTFQIPFNNITHAKKKADELKKKLLEDLENGKLDDEMIEIMATDAPKAVGIMPGMGPDMDISNILGYCSYHLSHIRASSIRAMSGLHLSLERIPLVHIVVLIYTVCICLPICLSIPFSLSANRFQIHNLL